MTEFAGRTAVVTGGGSGMGRELVRQLVAEACNVAMCDVSAEGMAETQRLCEAAGLPQGLRVTTHIADVARAERRDIARQHALGALQTRLPLAGTGAVPPVPAALPGRDRRCPRGGSAGVLRRAQGPAWPSGLCRAPRAAQEEELVPLRQAAL